MRKNAKWSGILAVFGLNNNEKSKFFNLEFRGILGILGILVC
ncbi:hypothetical protein [Campylobacter sp.]|nr:hypothetical protein [Campylobacter sp.]